MYRTSRLYICMLACEHLGSEAFAISAFVLDSRSSETLRRDGSSRSFASPLTQKSDLDWPSGTQDAREMLVLVYQ